jgi:hypothetical protein
MAATAGKSESVEAVHLAAGSWYFYTREKHSDFCRGMIF